MTVRTWSGIVCVAVSCLALPLLTLPLVAADSIHIVSITPASGNFPMSAPGGKVAVEWELQSSPFGRLSVDIASTPAPGPGQSSLGSGFVPVWVSKGRGRAEISFFGACSPPTIPAGTVTQVRARLMQSQHNSGPIGAQLAQDLKAVQYPYACPQNPVGGPGKPDITSKKGITLGGAVGGAGGKFVAWGGTVQLTGADSSLPKANGQCTFNASYDMENIGGAATSPAFLNRLKSDANVVAVNSGLALNAAETKQINPQPYLTPGKHVLSLHLDDDHQVAESNEGNNDFRIVYVLDAKCGAASK
jgi:hypothetical protein